MSRLRRHPGSPAPEIEPDDEVRTPTRGAAMAAPAPSSTASTSCTAGSASRSRAPRPSSAPSAPSRSASCSPSWPRVAFIVVYVGSVPTLALTRAATRSHLLHAAARRAARPVAARPRHRRGALGKLLIPRKRRSRSGTTAASPTRTGRSTAAATLATASTTTGLARRSLLQRSLALAVRALGAAAARARSARLIKKPGNALAHTCWAAPVRSDGVPLIYDDGRPVRPGDIQAGGIATVFPAGAGRLPRSRADSADAADPAAPEPDRQVARKGQADFGWGDTCVLQDLHARRLPGVAVRAADQPAALPLPPVAVRPAAGREAGVRACRPAAAEARDHRGRRGILRRQGRLHRARSGPASGSGHERRRRPSEPARQAAPRRRSARPRDWARRALDRSPVTRSS